MQRPEDIAQLHVEGGSVFRSHAIKPLSLFFVVLRADPSSIGAAGSYLS
jgi:hypothetical protein